MDVTHFTLDEFSASQVATRKGIDNRIPTDLEFSAWATLCMLEKIRAHLSEVAGKDCPVTILSGYRCDALNDVVGGVPSSDHVKGRAADICAPVFGTPLEVAQELAKHVDDLDIGQLINEHPGPGGWVHVSTRMPDKLVNRIITITAQGTEVGVVA